LPPDVEGAYSSIGLHCKGQRTEAFADQANACAEALRATIGNLVKELAQLFAVTYANLERAKRGMKLCAGGSVKLDVQAGATPDGRVAKDPVVAVLTFKSANLLCAQP
jgi:hypothetical protein